MCILVCFPVCFRFPPNDIDLQVLLFSASFLNQSVVNLIIKQLTVDSFQQISSTNNFSSKHEILEKKHSTGSLHQYLILKNIIPPNTFLRNTHPLFLNQRHTIHAGLSSRNHAPLLCYGASGVSRRDTVRRYDVLRCLRCAPVG